jgi:uncharacterized protein (TIGR03437 family)
VGSVYVFVRSGGVWKQQQELTASDGTVNDRFGFTVAVSGDIAVVGASAKDINSKHAQGAAYVFVRSGGVWTQQQELTAADGATLDQFGGAVAVSGNTVLIGAFYKTVGSNAEQGAAYVFVQSGAAWTQQQELTATDGAAKDHLGYSVSLSGDTALIGAPDRTTGKGAAYVFVRSSGAWTQQQVLTALDAVAGSYSNGNLIGGDLLGGSVAVSGGTAVVGAFNKNSYRGAAYVFAQSGTAWTQQQELTAADGAAGDYFARSVAVSGGTAVIGAYQQNGAQGAAYVFTQSGTAWTQQQELTASDGAANDNFGDSVSLSGGTALIGAAGHTVGSNAYQGAAYAIVATGPIIAGVAVSGGGVNIAQNAWTEIYGANLAPSSAASGLTWSTAPSFASGVMPTSLDGVSVTVNGIPAYIYYISPTQINVLTPLDSTVGPVAVVVNNGTTTTAAYTANLQAVSPGFLRFGDFIHIVAQHADWTFVGPVSLSVPGYTFTPAVPGEVIVLYGDGFGLPVTTLTAGSMYQSGALPEYPQITIGGVASTVQYAAVISPGLYQINVLVPTVPSSGDNQVIATYGGVSSPTGAMIPVAE